jgi:phosphatidylserine/phosphatidylglycerophosphate/cardiolipin synthase-like enzyme
MKKLSLLMLVIFTKLLVLPPLFIHAQSYAFFAPDDKPTTKLIELIKNAKTSIHAAIYMLTDKTIAQALADAKKQRNIEIKIIVDTMSTHQYGKANFLHENNIEVYLFDHDKKEFDPAIFNCPSIMHNKFLIIDEKTLWTGSFNWTVAANRKNQENVIVIDDKNICEQYEHQFIKIMKERCNRYLGKTQYKKIRKNKKKYSTLRKNISLILKTSRNNTELLNKLTRLIARYQKKRRLIFHQAPFKN